MTLLIVDQWQPCVCCTRSGVIRCTLLMVLYLDRICQCGLHAVLWSHIGTPPRCRTSQYRRPLFPSQCPSGAILLTPYLMVWNSRVSRAGPMLFWPVPTIVFYYFSFSLISVFRLVMWGGVYHSLSALHCRPFLIIIKNNKVFAS